MTLQKIMDADGVWAIYDRATGRKASIAVYLSPARALEKIDQWKHRQELGGRPDISREQLDRLVVRKIA